MAARLRRWSVVLLSVLTLLLAGRSTAGQILPSWAGTIPSSPVYSGCGGDIAPAINPAYEQQVVELVNTTRAGQGLPPLKRNTGLDDAARYFSTDMGQDNYYGVAPNDHDTHDRQGGTLIWTCAMASRIAFYYSSYTSIAENIAQGYDTPQEVMNGWMNSPPHKNNILSAASWEIGVGYYTGSGDHAPYWTQDFGRQPGVYPVIINGEAALTTSRNVTIYTYGSGDWDEMCVSNDGAACTSWLPFQPSMSWTLNSGKGNHTVTVQLRRGAQTTTSSDTIFLDEGSTPPPGPRTSTHLPMILKNHGTTFPPTPGWTTILVEDFEGTFPGAWDLSDLGAGAGDYLWSKSPCRPFAGSNSGWAVGGVNGSGLPCGSNYPDGVQSWMIYGPFSLADATRAGITFQLWLNSQTDHDFVLLGASTDRTQFNGYQYWGDSGGWTEASLDLSAVPTQGDLTGKPEVYVTLVFGSDAGTNLPEGAYADDIVLRKYVPSAAQITGAEPAFMPPPSPAQAGTLSITEAEITSP